MIVATQQVVCQLRTPPSVPLVCAVVLPGVRNVSAVPLSGNRRLVNGSVSAPTAVRRNPAGCLFYTFSLNCLFSSTSLIRFRVLLMRHHTHIFFSKQRKQSQRKQQFD
jgi:hypothetical protein